MLGKNHVVSTVCSAVGLSAVVNYGSKYYVGAHSETIAKISNTVIDFVTPNNDVELWSKAIWWLIAAAALFLGAVLPDIDDNKSFLGRYIHIPIEHHALTHTVWCVGILIAISIPCPAFVWCAIGYTIHLFWDSLGYCGVCWFYPISKYRIYPSGAKVKRRHFIRLYRTGSKVEYVLIGIIVASTAAFAFFLFIVPRFGLNLG